MMKIKLPRGYEIEIDERNEFALPEDFEEEITRTFGEYTLETSKYYTYADKLSFIDLCVSYMNGTKHSPSYAYDTVIEKVKRVFAYELEENGEFIEEEDVYNLDFMGDCYMDGRKDCVLFQDYNEYDRYKKEAKQKLLVEIIKIVMRYEKDE